MAKKRTPEPELFRPEPPEELLEAGREVEIFRPAPELEQWIRTAFLEGGPLVNYDHEHLLDADIACLWTTAECVKDQRPIAATAEVLNLSGRKWGKARERFQWMEWFGRFPDFVLTFDAIIAAETDDWCFCARCDHELYHCAQRRNREGEPMFDGDGDPVWAIQGHDVEEHLGVVERWGPVGSNVARLVEIAQRKPLIARASMELACGTCGGRVR